MGWAGLVEAWPRIDGFHMRLYKRLSGSTLLLEGLETSIMEVADLR